MGETGGGPLRQPPTDVHIRVTGELNNLGHEAMSPLTGGMVKLSSIGFQTKGDTHLRPKTADVCLRWGGLAGFVTKAVK